jgi:hypothetical protein
MWVWGWGWASLSAGWGWVCDVVKWVYDRRWAVRIGMNDGYEMGLHDAGDDDDGRQW